MLFRAWPNLYRIRKIGLKIWRGKYAQALAECFSQNLRIKGPIIEKRLAEYQITSLRCVCQCCELPGLADGIYRWRMH